MRGATAPLRVLRGGDGWRRRGHRQIALLMHSAPEHSQDREYLHLFFLVDGWRVESFIAEPDKCSELRWVDDQALPPDVVDYVGEALLAIRRGESLALHGW